MACIFSSGKRLQIFLNLAAEHRVNMDGPCMQCLTTWPC